MRDIATIADLTPDPENPNAGTERGDYLIESSIEKTGLNRAVVVDRNGVIVAGNKTTGKAGELGFEDVILVKTDGKRLVVIQRDDWDLLEDAAPRLYSYLDNQSAYAGIRFTGAHIEAHSKVTDLNVCFSHEELLEIMGIKPKEKPKANEEKTHADQCPNCGYLLDVE